MRDIETQLADALHARADEAARAGHRLVNPEVATRRVRSRRALLPVAAAAVLVLLVAIIPLLSSSRSSTRAYAATPPLLHYTESPVQPPASELLTHLADLSAAQPAPRAGRYHYLDTDSWSLFTSVVGDHATSTTNLTPARRQVWTDDSGAGRQRSTFGGRVQTSRLPAGRSFDVPALSTDPVTLARQLSVGHPTSNGPAEVVDAVVDLWQQQAPRPQVQAAVLRVLAATPGFVDSGAVRDRAGRSGVAVSIDSDYSGLPTQYTLVFDSGTGMLLDYEAVLTTSAGKLNVPIPSVLQYIVWRQHGDVDALGRVPATAR